MSKTTLRMVENGRMYYPPTLLDYNVTCALHSPTLKITQNMLPLLKQRCKNHKVKVKIYPFSEVEEKKFRKIRERWPYGFVVKGNRILIEVPKKKILFDKAQSLVEAICGFYNRNLFDVEVSSRRFAGKIRFVIERNLNEQREPGWK